MKSRNRNSKTASTKSSKTTTRGMKRRDRGVNIFEALKRASSWRRSTSPISAPDPTTGKATRRRSRPPSTPPPRRHDPVCLGTYDVGSTLEIRSGASSSATTPR